MNHIFDPKFVSLSILCELCNGFLSCLSFCCLLHQLSFNVSQTFSGSCGGSDRRASVGFHWHLVPGHSRRFQLWFMAHFALGGFWGGFADLTSFASLRSLIKLNTFLRGGLGFFLWISWSYGRGFIRSSRSSNTRHIIFLLELLIQLLSFYSLILSIKRVSKCQFFLLAPSNPLHIRLNIRIIITFFAHFYFILAYQN